MALVAFASANTAISAAARASAVIIVSVIGCIRTVGGVAVVVTIAVSSASYSLAFFIEIHIALTFRGVSEFGGYYPL